MKKWLNWIYVAGLFSCSPNIISYQNPDAKYERFETYRIVNLKVDKSQLDKESALVYSTIRKEIEHEMTKRDYALSDVSPDLILRYELTSSSRVQTTAQQVGFSPYYNVSSRTIHESILLLELIDQNKKLVWQGSYDLQQERKESRLVKVIENAVAKIFTSYPYRALMPEPDQALTSLKKKDK